MIDTVLSLVPKIGLIYLFHDLTKDLCLASLNVTFWLPSEASRLHGPGRVIHVNDTSLQARKHCEIGLVSAQAILLAILVLWTAAQWGLGLGIRRYALKLELAEYRSAPVDEEKQAIFYREDSIADEYHDAVKAVQKWTWPSRSDEKLLMVVIDRR